MTTYQKQSKMSNQGWLDDAPDDLPRTDLQVNRIALQVGWFRLEVDLGTVFLMSATYNEGLIARVRELILEVDRICGRKWEWAMQKRMVEDHRPEFLESYSIDFRQFLTLNISSASDAMLVRISIPDTVVIKSL